MTAKQKLIALWIWTVVNVSIVVFCVVKFAEASFKTTNISAKNIDEVKPYIRKFLEEHDKRCPKTLDVSRVEFAFGDIKDRPRHKDKSRTIGYCQGDSRIVLDRKFWKNSNSSEKEQLIFHELGHCILNRDHLDDLHKSKRPVSIMHSVLVDDIDYVTHRKEYINELFK